MGLWNKFKNYIDMPEPEYDENGDEIIEEEEKEPPREKAPGQSKKYTRAADYSAGDDIYRDFESPRAQTRTSAYKSSSQPHSTKVVDIHTTAKLQVVLTKPEKFADAREIADNLNEKRTVVLNLESTSKDEALRLLDFLSGVAYANDGEIKKIAKSTFIITPYNVDVMGDLLYELESNGLFFI